MVWQNCDMNEEMRQDCVDVVITASERYQSNYEVCSSSGSAQWTHDDEQTRLGSGESRSRCVLHGLRLSPFESVHFPVLVNLHVITALAMRLQFVSQDRSDVGAAVK